MFGEEKYVNTITKRMTRCWCIAVAQKPHIVAKRRYVNHAFVSLTRSLLESINNRDLRVDMYRKEGELDVL